MIYKTVNVCIFLYLACCVGASSFWRTVLNFITNDLQIQLNGIFSLLSITKHVKIPICFLNWKTDI